MIEDIENINNIKFLVPREIYDNFIIGVCMETLRVIYDAEKIIHLNILPALRDLDLYKNVSEVDLMVDAIDDFHHNHLFESKENSKFIYSFSSYLEI